MNYVTSVSDINILNISWQTPMSDSNSYRKVYRLLSFVNASQYIIERTLMYLLIK